MARVWIRAVFFLAALVFLSRNAGEMTHQLERMFGLLFFTVFAASHIERRLFERRAGSVLLGVVILAAGLALLRVEPVTDVLAVAVMTLGLWYIVGGMGLPAKHLLPYSLTALAFALLLLLGKTSSYAWYMGRWLSDVACAISNGLAGSSIDFRPNYAGLPITALLLLFWGIRWSYAEKQRPRDLAGLAGLTLAAQLLYLIAAAETLNLCLPIVERVAGKSFDELKWYEAFLKRSMPWNLPLLLFLINVPAILWGAGRIAHAVEPSAAPKDAKARLQYVHYALIVLVLVILVVVTLIPCLPGRRTAPEGKTIVFYEKGFLNWSKPQFGNYGPLSVGMFGNLPDFVETLGLESRMAPAITTNTLDGAAALVIINPNDPWDDGTTETIWRFVEMGGSLLLLGDHTAYDEKTGRVYVNELLAPSAIRFNFDSADCPVGGWLHCYDFQWHPLTRGLRDQRNEAGIVVGASLAIRRPACPIVLGRHGYEDRGNLYARNRAFLGDMEFNPDEPLGGPVLVASQRYGKGKVLVFGDTSSYVNGILVSTYNFLGRIFKWLAVPGGHQAMALPAVFSLAALLGLLLLLQAGLLPGRRLLLLWMVLAGAVVLSATPARAPRHEIRRDASPVRIAYVDQTHMPIASQEGWRENGLMGLQMNLMRSGLLTFNLHDGRLPQDADLYVIVAPARRFRGRAVRDVRRYLENGGNIIVAVGHEERFGAERLLSEFGLEVKYTPLGYFRTTSPKIKKEAMFWEAWEVADREKDKEKTAQIISGFDKHPVIILKKVPGKTATGNLVLIGDSQFLQNRNIESEESYNQSNIDFLRALVDYLGIGSQGGSGR